MVMMMMAFKFLRVLLFIILKDSLFTRILFRITTIIKRLVTYFNFLTLTNLWAPNLRRCRKKASNAIPIDPNMSESFFTISISKTAKLLLLLIEREKEKRENFQKIMFTFHCV